MLSGAGFESPGRLAVVADTTQIVPFVTPERFRGLVRAVVEDAHTLTREEARGVLGSLLLEASDLSGTDQLLGALLTAMAVRGETGEELCGFAEAMRAAAHPMPLMPPLTADEREQLVDTCGTGGDGLDTFNISTAAALVAAGAGARVAKHGNRAVTSRCGSADVLEALGVPVELSPAEAAECLRSTGFVFLLAPAMHPAMRRVAPVRRALPFRTAFNLLGPLSNPAGARRQLLGVYAEARLPAVAEAVRLLGTEHAWVVHGRVGELVSGAGPASAGRGLDELTVTEESVYMEIRAVGTQFPNPVACTLAPASLGLPLAPLSALRGGATAAENAAMLESIVRGTDIYGVAVPASTHDARRDIVVLNAAATLLVAGVAPTLAEGLERARASVESGAATRVLERLRGFGAAASRAGLRSS